MLWFVPIQLGLSLDETITEKDLDDLLWIFGCESSAVSKVLVIALQIQSRNSLAISGRAHICPDIALWVSIGSKTHDVCFCEATNGSFG